MGVGIDRAPQFLSVLLLFILPFLIQPEGQDPLLPQWAITQLLVLMILIAWMLKVIVSGKLFWVNSKALIAIVLLFLWLGITVAFSSYSKIGIEHLKDSVCYILWFLVLTFTSLEAWQGENLLIAFLISGFASMYLGHRSNILAWRETGSISLAINLKVR